MGSRLPKSVETVFVSGILRDDVKELEEQLPELKDKKLIFSDMAKGETPGAVNISRIEKCDAALFVTNMGVYDVERCCVEFGVSIQALNSHNIYILGPATYFSMYDRVIPKENKL